MYEMFTMILYQNETFIKKGAHRMTNPKATTKLAVQPKMFFKNNKEHIHHLFKAEVAKCKKNMSWQKGVVQIEEVEHCHFFHTINSQGIEQTYTSPIAGHFHKITWKTDSEGNLIAECGPALHKRMVKKPNGEQKTKIEEIKFHDGMSDDGAEYIKDNHTHIMTYKGSEIITKKSVQALQQSNLSAVTQLQEFDSTAE